MTELKITTFNIRCFGFGGDYFKKEKSEHRLSFLKDFIESNFLDTDVFILQEIMNPLLVHKILPEGFKTYTYSHSYKRHMFIVIACKKEFDIEDFQTIPGTALDNEKSRLSVYGKLHLNSQPLLDLIGVHLKSKHDHTESRLIQARAISNFINEKLTDNKPLVMTGDFNCHLKKDTLKDKDDLDYLKEVFKDQLALVEHHQNTYLSATQEMSLDQFFMRHLKTLDIKVYNLPDYAPTQPFKNFYDEISDHLPVTLHLKINPLK